jgi:Na+-driven multidrug efflux pump
MLIPMLFFQSQFDVTYKFVNCFSKTYPVVGIQIITLLTHVFLCEVLVNYMRLDLFGICISTNLNPIFNLIMVTIWIEKYEKATDMG